MATKRQSSRPKTEKELYPLVERWMRRRFRCFRTAVHKGLKHSRIDVLGVRDAGGDLSGQMETIAIEVRRGNYAFATATGQTLGYNVYANRVYLADIRDTDFSSDELEIASHLGVGLIRIRSGRCTEVLSSPFYRPMDRLKLLLLEAIGLGTCQLCGCVFEITEADSYRFSALSRENLKKAIEEEKGMMFWNHEVAERKRRLGVRPSPKETTYERRFLCADCTRVVAGNATELAQ